MTQVVEITNNPTYVDVSGAISFLEVSESPTYVEVSGTSELIEVTEQSTLVEVNNTATLVEVQETPTLVELGNAGPQGAVGTAFLISTFADQASSPTYCYYGGLDYTGAWKVNRFDSGLNKTSATEVNNPLILDLATAQANVLTLTYA